MKPVEFDTDAVEEVREAVAFLNGFRPGFGDEFEAEPERGVDLIGRQPRAFSPDPDVFRKYVLKRFGYVVIYFEYADYVWIATVHHGSRKPEYWRDRQPPR